MNRRLGKNLRHNLTHKCLCGGDYRDLIETRFSRHLHEQQLRVPGGGCYLVAGYLWEWVIQPLVGFLNNNEVKIG